MPPPAPTHPTNQRSSSHQMALQQFHSHPTNQMTPALGFTRYLPRAARPRSMSLDPYPFHLTPELIAEIDRTHSTGPGMSGVAYAGGAISGPVSIESSSFPEESILRLAYPCAYRKKHPIPLGPEEGPTGVQRRNTCPCDMDRETWGLHRRDSVERDSPQRVSTQPLSPELEAQRRASPKYSHSLSDPGNRTSYKPSDCELLLDQAAALSPNPSDPRQSPCTESLRSTPHSVARVHDKSSPIQEESEEHDTHSQEQEGDRWNLDECEDKRPAERYGQEGRDPGRQQYAASPPTASSGPVAANHAYPQSPLASHYRPGAPIPPTTYSYTTTTSPSPSPLVSGMSRANEMKTVLPSYSPVPRAGSPYPYPFGHIPRKSYAGLDNETMGLSQVDPNVVREQRHLQLQTNALTNEGVVSDSTLSSSSTPLRYDPLTFLRANKALSGRRGGIGDSQASTRSSPSHQPVSLQPFCRGDRGRRRPNRSQHLRQQSKTLPPPRVENTQPRDTSPEFSLIEDTAGGFNIGEHPSEPQQPVSQLARRDESPEDEDDADDEKWVDEDAGLEGIADNDLLQLEFHPDYVGDPEKRRRRWKHRWEIILHNVSVLRDRLGRSDPGIWLDAALQFRALDRETNTALVLLAAPSHTGKLHSVASRAVRRDSSLKSTDMKNIRSAFAEISSRQHTMRTASLLEQLSQAHLSSRDRSPSTSRGAREKDLRRALDTAIGSLHALGTLYERREMRWAEEKLRLDEEKGKVELVLKQVLGTSIFGTVGDPATA